MELGQKGQSVWDILEEKGWTYLPYWSGWRHPLGRHFILEAVIFRMPGEVIHFLRTGRVRNIKIFDNGLNTPTPESLGFKAHKDGTCVELRLVK